MNQTTCEGLTIIDCQKERLITFNEAARFLPKSSRPNASTWWRWYARGWHGIRLETVRAGKRRLTSAAAVQRFLAAVTAIEDGPLETPPAKAAVSPAKNAAEKFLAAEGILPPT